VRADRSQPLRRLQRRVPLLQVIALAVLFVYGAASIKGFSDWLSIKSMLTLASLLALAALGQTLIVILGGLDLSIPGFIVLGAFAVTQLYGADGWPAAAAIVVLVLVAAGMGATTGFICHRFQIQPLVVTLGMGALASGLAVAWTGGAVEGIPPAFLSKISSPAATTFGIDIPPVVVITGVVAVIMAVTLYRTVPGRLLYATGDNPRAADMAGISTGLVWVAAFAASAAIASLVGVLLAGFSGADQSLGTPYLFQGLTAVIVGGTALGGSRGDYTHTLVGAGILIVLTTVLIGKGVDTPTSQMIFGILILLVVAGYGRDRRLRDRV
jgi:ribose transport system permease protein